MPATLSVATSFASSGQHYQHPRRSTRKSTSSSSSVESSSSTITYLQKSGTFHSPTSHSSSLYDPLKDSKFKRSQTNVDCLENLTGGPGPRIAAILATFEKTAAGDADLSDETFNEQDDLPVPSVTVGHSRITPDPDRMEVDQSVDAEHHHASDSGIGTSVDTTTSGSKSIASGSAVTKSFTATQTSDARRPLSEHAIEQINNHILIPILRESALKDFHPLVKDVPRRINSKVISNLRDLEKTFVFLAPDLSATPDSYLRFCETSIQCIHATVDFISEADQRLPSDRPYTNYYFLDLIEQIRKYAAVLAATREKVAAGEDLDEMDYSPEEKISVRGGIGHDGKPIELVREKDGKLYSLAEGANSPLLSTKRPLSPIIDDEGVRRSMGRRRKSDKAGDIIRFCRDCNKTFSRPCDLTKHEKTHSRPWKCTEPSCRYATDGWPTEKERDRHVNDKHCPNPTMFKCHFSPCTYSSKRASNCKQHMEKAHNYYYPRAKGNKTNVTSTNKRTVSTVDISTVSPVSTSSVFTETPVSIPQSSVGPSPEAPLLQRINDDYDMFGSGIAPMQPTPISIPDLEGDIGAFSASAGELFSDTTQGILPLGANAFNIGTLSDVPEPLTMPMQQPTPAHSGVHIPISDFGQVEPYLDVLNSDPRGQATVSGFSPGAEPNLVLSLPSDVRFDGTVAGSEGAGAVSRDFTLYPQTSLSGETASMGLFQPLDVYIGQADGSCFHTTDDAFNDDQLYSVQ